MAPKAKARSKAKARGKLKAGAREGAKACSKAKARGKAKPTPRKRPAAHLLRELFFAKGSARAGREGAKPKPAPDAKGCPEPAAGSCKQARKGDPLLVTLESPLAPRGGEPPLKQGSAMPKEFCSRLLARLSSGDLDALASWVQQGCFGGAQASTAPQDAGDQGAAGPAISMVTLCSGTDSPVLALTALCEALHEERGVRPRCDHLWSCENNVAKQDFIKAAFPSLKCLFEDATALTFPRAKCAIRGGTAPVVVGNLLVAGFPCTDVSALNPRASTQEHKNIIASGTRSTGSVFAAIQRILKDRSGVKAAILENVLGLASQPAHASNLKVVLDQLADAGMVSVAFHLDPAYFGTPQRRGRVWIISLRESWLKEASPRRTPTEFVDKLKELVQSFVGHPVTPLDEFLSKEDSPEVAAHYEVMRSLPDPSSRPPPDPKAKWMSESASVMSQPGFVNELPEALCDALPGLRELSRREWFLLQGQGLRADSLPQANPLVIVDTSQSMARAKQPATVGQTSPVGCLTPRGSFFHSGRCRRLLGHECLRLQCIYYGPDGDEMLRQFPEALLHNLAGNAFNVHCCSAALLALFVAVAAMRDEAAVKGGGSPSLDQGSLITRVWCGSSSESDGDGSGSD